MKKLNSKNCAFSLIELSITVLIISILIAAVVKGGSIIEKAQIASQKLSAKSTIENLPDILYSSNNVLWLDSANINGNYNIGIRKGDRISQWNDLSKYKNHLTQENSNYKPQFSSDGVLFDYVDDSQKQEKQKHMFAKGKVLDHDDYSYAIIFVASTNYNNFFIFGQTSTNSSDFDINHHFALNSNNQLNVDEWRPSGGSISSQPLVADEIFDTNNIGKNNIYIANRGFETNKINFYFNSKNVTNGSNYSETYQGTSNVKFILGTRYHLGLIHHSFQGELKEMIVFDRALSSQELTDISHYLSRKWKITSKVDSDGDGFFDSQDKKPTDISQH